MNGLPPETRALRQLIAAGFLNSERGVEFFLGALAGTLLQITISTINFFAGCVSI